MFMSKTYVLMRYVKKLALYSAVRLEFSVMVIPG